jgi:mannose-6-phosphate isomerase-like protein (cupin superfamily)
LIGRNGLSPGGCSAFAERGKGTTVTPTGPIGIQPAESLLHGTLSAVLRLSYGATRGLFSIVEQPLAPRALGAPVHTHGNEDEYSVILEGVIGLELGGETIAAKAGDVVGKPRGVPHAVWNRPTSRRASST